MVLYKGRKYHVIKKAQSDLKAVSNNVT